MKCLMVSVVLVFGMICGLSCATTYVHSKDQQQTVDRAKNRADDCVRCDVDNRGRYIKQGEQK